MKKAIVVGATSGIGKSLARLLVENGFQVGITGRRTQLLQEIKAKNPDNYFIKAFDVSQTNEITTNLDELVSELGGLDLLIISSGTGDINKELDFNIEKRTIETNVATFSCFHSLVFNPSFTASCLFKSISTPEPCINEAS